MTTCGRKLHWFVESAAFSIVLMVQSVERGKEIGVGGGGPIPLRRLSAIPAGLTHTTSAQEPMMVLQFN